MDFHDQYAVARRAMVKWQENGDKSNPWASVATARKVAAVNQEPCMAGDVRYFVKSGNLVILREALPSGHWVVERLRGASVGKQMICLDRALLWAMPGCETELIQQFDFQCLSEVPPCPSA